jgi:hypothetical protein
MPGFGGGSHIGWVFVRGRLRVYSGRARCATRVGDAERDRYGFMPQLDDSTAKVRPADRDIAPACRRGFP